MCTFHAAATRQVLANAALIQGQGVPLLKINRENYAGSEIPLPTLIKEKEYLCYGVP
jgi:hypothetical protein